MARCQSQNITQYYASVLKPGTSELLIVMELMAASVADLVCLCLLQQLSCAMTCCFLLKCTACRPDTVGSGLWLTLHSYCHTFLTPVLEHWTGVVMEVTWPIWLATCKTAEFDYMRHLPCSWMRGTWRSRR